MNTMNKQEIINKIKSFISIEKIKEKNVELQEEIVEEKFIDVIREDGVVLTIQEDGSVMIGEEVAPDGEHPLEDGSVLVVKDGKKVEEVEEEKPEDEEEMEVETPAEDELALEEENPEMETLLARVDQLELAVSQMLELMESSNTEMIAMESQIKILNDEPAEEEVKIKKTFNKKEERLSVLEKYAKIRNAK